MNQQMGWRVICANNKYVNLLQFSKRARKYDFSFVKSVTLKMKSLFVSDSHKLMHTLEYADIM